MQVAGDALAHLQQLAVGVDAVTDRQRDKQERTEQNQRRDAPLRHTPPTVHHALFCGARLVDPGFKLEPLVEPGHPLADGNQPPVRPETVG